MREDQPGNLKEALKEDETLKNPHLSSTLFLKQILVFLNCIVQQHKPECDISHQNME